MPIEVFVVLFGAIWVAPLTPSWVNLAGGISSLLWLGYIMWEHYDSD